MIYRAIAEEAFSPDCQYPMSTRRVPSNIPYLVDNMWEWLRPDHMPSRRTAVFASPQRELALQYANESTALCKVQLPRSARVAQVVDYPDARFHPDVKRLPRIMLGTLEQKWVDSAMTKKGSGLGWLYMPVLSKDEVDALLSACSLGQAIATQMKTESTFWQDTNLVDPNLHLTDGELFFHSPDGYHLAMEDI